MDKQVTSVVSENCEKNVKCLEKPERRIMQNVHLYIDDEHSNNDGCQQNCGCD